MLAITIQRETHRSLDQDAPVSRPVQQIGRIVFARPAWRAVSPIRPDLGFRHAQHRAEAGTGSEANDVLQNS
jgi:hypothetical protein